MMNVGGAYYSRIDNHPTCAADGCRKKVERRGGSILSAYCRRHSNEETERLMDGGLSCSEARTHLWVGRPADRLAFIR